MAWSPHWYPDVLKVFENNATLTYLKKKEKTTRKVNLYGKLQEQIARMPNIEMWIEIIKRIEDVKYM